MHTRRTLVVGVLLLTLVANLIVGLAVKNFAPVANAASNSTHARYSLVVFLDGVLPSMITPQTAPFITSLEKTGVHYTNADTAVPADSLTDITADFTGTFATQSGIPYE